MSIIDDSRNYKEYLSKFIFITSYVQYPKQVGRIQMNI